MDVTIMLVTNVNDASSRAPVTEIKGVLEEIPQRKGFEVQGGERKFVVLLRKDNPTDVLLLIGPEVISYYYHSALVQWAEINFPSYKVKGGGQVTFTSRVKSDGSAAWIARFHGKSGDFGVYHPSILMEKKLIEDQMEMYVAFSWEG